jgi:hypothetical protein
MIRVHSRVSTTSINRFKHITLSKTTPNRCALTYIEQVDPLVLLVLDPVLGVPTPYEQHGPDKGASMTDSWYRYLARSLYRHGREILTIEREQVVSDRFTDESAKYKKMTRLCWHRRQGMAISRER